MKKTVSYYVFEDCFNKYIVERFDKYEKIIACYPKNRYPAHFADNVCSGYNNGNLIAR